MPNQEQLIKDPDSGETIDHRPIKVLRLRGGTGETKNHEANEIPGCPETSIFSS